MDFDVQEDHKMKLKNRQKDEKIPGPYLRDEKAVEREGDSGTNLSWEESKPDHSTIKILRIFLDTKNIPGYLRRIAITPAKHHKLKIIVL